MDPNLSPLERAFELARSGECRTVDDIRKRLSREGYSTTQIYGPALLAQLRALIDAHGKPDPDASL
jgi:hypothetical protein